MDKPEIFRDTTPKQWYLVAYKHYHKTATPDFLRGLQAGFEAVTETGNGKAFLRGVRFALVNPSAALLAGVEVGIRLANHDGWRFVPVVWMQEYAEGIEGIIARYTASQPDCSNRLPSCCPHFFRNGRICGISLERCDALD